MVYASFPSPQLVPKDVVFGNYSNLGAVKESWTAACYILSAEFAEVLPPDEDPMPLDGNPHPLPGDLNHDLGIFVLPQYPELGWDGQQQNNGQGDDVAHDDPMQQQDQQDQEEPVEVQDSGSIVVNHSDNSVNSLPIQHQIVVNFMQFGLPDYTFGSTSVYGPALHPSMQWNMIFRLALPSLLAKKYRLHTTIAHCHL